MIHIYHSGGITDIEWSGESESISALLRRCEIFLDSPCSGNGKCGKCRVIAAGDISTPSDEEKAHLTVAELASGIRLACLARITGGDAEIHVPRQKDIEAVTEGLGETRTLNPFGKKLGLAVDIGTTTVAAYLYDLKTGRRLAAAAAKNPQSAFGADVVSRQKYSLGGGGDELAKAVRTCVNDLALELAANTGRSVSDLDAAVITGNTTMLYLFFGYDVDDIATAPFDARYLFGEFVPADRFFNDWAPGCTIYFPPCISAYVGADITCAILSSGMADDPADILLADIGTNGELAISSGGKLLCCATAAGPAFEGAGIELGSNALPGAVDRVWTDGHSISIHTIANAPAATICGSGLLDALAVFLDLHIMDETGRLDATDGDPVYLDNSDVYITQGDVRNVQLAKAAIRAGIETLIDYAGLSEAAPPRLYIAGGFGSKLNPRSAARIGMIPNTMKNGSLAIGNAAGLGAVNILLDNAAIKKCEDIIKRTTAIELSGNPKFSEHFIEQIVFEV